VGRRGFCSKKGGPTRSAIRRKNRDFYVAKKKSAFCFFVRGSARDKPGGGASGKNLQKVPEKAQGKKEGRALKEQGEPA